MTRTGRTPLAATLARMLTLHAILTLVAILSAPHAARGQETSRWQVHLNPYLGAFVFDDSEANDVGLEVNIGPILGARIVAPFRPAWWLEGAYGFAFLSVEPSEFREEDPDAVETDLGAHLLYGAIIYRIGSPDVATALLLSAGAGAIFLDPESGDGEAEFMIPLGVGFTHPVNDWITFRGDVKDHIVFCTASDGADANAFPACLDDEGLNNFEISGGLMFRLR